MDPNPEHMAGGMLVVVLVVNKHAAPGSSTGPSGNMTILSTPVHVNRNGNRVKSMSAAEAVKSAFWQLFRDL